MEMLKNTRNQTSQKFVIKSKLTSNHFRSENSDPELPTSVDHEVDLFLDHMIKKSKRFRDLLQDKEVNNTDEFCQTYLLKSVYLVPIH